MPHKGKKKYLKADAVAEEQKADSTAGVQIKNGESSALGGTSTKKPRTPSNNGPTSSKKGSGGSSGGGKGDRGGGAGMQHVKSAISRAKSADAVLQACTKGSEGVQSLSVNACCMALYAVAKMTDGGGKGKGGKGKGKGGKGGKGMKGSKVEKDDEDNTTDGTAGSDEQVADSAERWAELLEVLSTKAGEFDAKALTKATWALASLARRWPLPASVMAALAQRCSILASEFDAMAVASVLASLVKLTDAPPDSKATTSASTSGEACREAVAALHVRAMAIAPTFNGQDVANTLHACAKLTSSGRASRPSDALIASLTSRAACSEVLPTLRPKELVNILWACSTLRATTAAEAVPPTTLSALFQAVHKQCSTTFTSRDVSTVLWSLARGFSSAESSSSGKGEEMATEVSSGKGPRHGNAPLPVPLLKALVSRAAVLVPTFNGQDVANTLWALAKLSNFNATTTPSGRSSESNNNDSNEKGYLAAFPPVELVAALESQFARVLPTCNGQNVSNGLWAIMKLNRSLPLNVLEAACARLLHVTSTMQPLQVADALWALGNDRRNHAKGPGAKAAALLATAVTPETVANMTPHDLAIAGFALARIVSSSSSTGADENDEEDDDDDEGEEDKPEGTKLGHEHDLQAVLAAGHSVVAQAAKLYLEDGCDDLTAPQLCYLLWASAKLRKVAQTTAETLASAAFLSGNGSISDVLALAKALKPSLDTLHAQNVGLVAWAIAATLAEPEMKPDTAAGAASSYSKSKSIAKFAKAVLLRAAELSPTDLGWQSVAHVDSLRRGLMAHQTVHGGKVRAFKELHTVLVERAALAADALTAVTSARTRALEDAVVSNKDIADWCAGRQTSFPNESKTADTSNDNGGDHATSRKKVKKSHKKDASVCASSQEADISVSQPQQQKQLLLVGCSADLAAQLESSANNSSSKGVHVTRWLRFTESTSSNGADQPQTVTTSACPPLPRSQKRDNGSSSSEPAPEKEDKKSKKRGRSSSSSGGEYHNDEGKRCGLFDGAVVRLPLAKAACDMALHMCAARLKPGAPLWGVALADENCAGRLPTLQQQENKQPQRQSQEQSHEQEQPHSKDTPAHDDLPLWEYLGSSSSTSSTSSSSNGGSQGGLPAVVIWQVTRTTTSATRFTASASASSTSSSLQGSSDEELLNVWAKDSKIHLPSWADSSNASSRGVMNPPGRTPPTQPALTWRTYPGLFARGGLDVMTAALLNALPMPPSKDDSSSSRRPRLLDFACGSGTIGATLMRASPSAEVHFLDADAVALEASKVNVPLGVAKKKQRVFHHLSDGFTNLDDHGSQSDVALGGSSSAPSSKRLKQKHEPTTGASDKGGATESTTKKTLRFDWIVSNPPVHCGLTDDFHVVRSLAAGAPERLRPGGSLWIVAQSYVPVGALLEAVPAFDSVDLYFTDGRFAVWRASVL